MTATVGFVPLEACVVVPARDEEVTIAACLAALAAQEGVDPAAYEVLLVLDACTDATEDVAAAAAAAHPWLRVRPLRGHGRGVGEARKLGMDLAARTLVAAGRGRGLIASTDADTVVAPDWLRTQLDLVADGADAIGGAIDLHEPAVLGDGILRRREARAAARMSEVRAIDPHAGHHHFSGASMSVTADAYLAVGGIEPLAALEDEGLERRLRSAGIGVRRPAAVRVRTAPRLAGRAPRGLAADLALDHWLARRSYAAGDFLLERLLATARDTVSVVVTATDRVHRVGPVLAHVLELESAGVVDEVRVVDAGAGDELVPGHGPVLGRGDAMWRGLASTTGDVVVFLDADAGEVNASWVRGMVGPLLCHPELAFVQGSSRHPGDARGAGELLARPLLNLHVPELAGFARPLATEIAARRTLLQRIAFPVGPGAGLALLLDARREAGMDALGRVDLGERGAPRAPDHEEAAYAILVAAARRLGSDVVPGPYVRPEAAGVRAEPVAVDERPPLGGSGA